MTTEEKQLTARNPCEDALLANSDRILAALPDAITPERFLQLCVGMLRTNEDLARCDPRSVLLAFYGCASLGLYPGDELGHVYLVPFNKIATIIPGYRGLIELARRSGTVSTVHTGIVYEAELTGGRFVDLRGTTNELRHEPLHVPKDELGPPRYVWCVANLRSGDQQIEVVPYYEIETVRDQQVNRISEAKRKYTPWVKHELEMARKTAVRRASKYWPLSSDLASAVAWDEQQERGVQQRIAPPKADFEVEKAEPPSGRVSLDTSKVPGAPGDDGFGFPGVEDDPQHPPVENQAGITTIDVQDAAQAPPTKEPEHMDPLDQQIDAEIESQAAEVFNPPAKESGGGVTQEVLTAKPLKELRIQDATFALAKNGDIPVDESEKLLLAWLRENPEVRPETIKGWSEVRVAIIKLARMTRGSKV